MNMFFTFARRVSRAIPLGLWLALASAPAAAPVPLARIADIARLLPARPAGFGETITNRPAWDKLAGAGNFADLLAKAQTLAKKPVPKLTDEVYLDYSRTGDRRRGEAVQGSRSNRLADFTLAECLENQGHFIRPLVETIDAIDAERTWMMPAHDGNLQDFYGESVDLDLRATALAWDLATADYLLGDRLPAATRAALRANIQRRVLQPFRAMVEGRRPENFWLHARYNWNSVCLAGVLGAALAVDESPAERAWFVAATTDYAHFYLDGFAPDGYCYEGIGYWNYGFGHYAMLCELIRQATANRLDPLANPAALPPALYGFRTEILNGIYPTISDAAPGGKPDPKFVRFLDERLGLNLPAPAATSFSGYVDGLAESAMFNFLPEPLPVVQHETITPDSPLRTWFPLGGVLISRPAPGASPFAVAIKGGHNGENHGHNDLGSYSVVAGKSVVLCDPGGEVYTKRTFGPHRFESKVLNSYGHSVPLVAGVLQSSGPAAQATVLHTDFTPAADTLSLDLKSAYAVKDLQRLERTYVYHRTEPASFTVTDEVAFARPEHFETALITWGDIRQINANELLISETTGAVRVSIDTGGIPFTLKTETINENVHTPKQPVRIGIVLSSPVQNARVITSISPQSK